MANDSEIKIKVGFEPGEVPPEVFERITKQAKAFKKEFTDSADAAQNLRENAQGMAEMVNDILNVASRLGNELQADNVADAFGSMEDAERFTRMGAEADALIQKQRELAESTRELWERFRAGEVPASQMEAVLTRNLEELARLDERAKQIQTDTGKGLQGVAQIEEATIKQLRIQVKELDDGLRAAFDRVDEVRTQSKEAGDAIGRVFAAVKAQGNKDLLGMVTEASGGKGMVQQMLNLESAGAKYEQRLQGIQTEMADVVKAVQAGTMFYDEGLEKVTQLSREMLELEKILKLIPAAFDTVGRASTVMSRLDSFQAVSDEVTRLRGEVDAMLGPLQENTQAWRDYQAGLDATSESYAEEYAVAQQAIAQNLAMEDALTKQKAALDERGKAVKVSAKIYDGTSDSAKDATKAMSEHTAALEKDARTNEALSARTEAMYSRRDAAAKRSAEAREHAEAKAAEAAEAAADAAAREAYEMELATMSAAQLAEEIERLTAAREAAAEANDAEAYEKITEQLVKAKMQQRALKGELNMAKTAMFGQAQAGMMLGQQLTTFSEKLESGEMSLSAFTSSVMGMGMALQSIQGPIGWVMVGVQLLSMVISRLAAAQEEERKREEKHRDSLRELRKAVRELREENKLLQMQKESDLQLKQTAFLFEKIAMATQERADTLNAVAKNQQAYNDAKAQDRTLETEAAVVKIQTDILAGLKTRIDGEREIAKLKLAQNKADLQKEIDDAERKAKNARELADNARKRENDVQQTYQNAIQSRTDAGYTIDPRILKNTEKEMEAVWAYLEKNYGFGSKNDAGRDDKLDWAIDKYKKQLYDNVWGAKDGDEEMTKLFDEAKKKLAELRGYKDKLDALRNDPTLWSSLAEGKGGVAGYEIEYEKHKKQEEIAEQALAAARSDADRAEKDSNAAAEVAAKVRQSNNKRLKQLDTLDKEHDKQTDIQKKNAKDDKAHGERMNRLRARLEDMTAAQVDAQYIIARGAAQEKGISEQEKKRRKEIVTLYEQRRKQLRKELNNAADTRLGLVNGKVQQGVNKKETAKNRKASGQALAAWAQEAKASKGDLSDDADIARWYGDNKQLADTLINALDKKQAKKVREAINGLVKNVKTAGLDGESELTRALQELTAAAEKTPDVADDKTASTVLAFASKSNTLIKTILDRHDVMQTGLSTLNGQLDALKRRVETISKRGNK